VANRYWHTRDITNRLIAERHERRTPAQPEECQEGVVMALLAQSYLIECEFDGNMLTQWRIEDDYG
jgi:hypothetical protein